MSSCSRGRSGHREGLPRGAALEAAGEAPPRRCWGGVCRQGWRRKQERCPPFPPPAAALWDGCFGLLAASVSPRWTLGPKSGKQGPGPSRLAPQGLGSRLSHTSAQMGTGANARGRRSLVLGNREQPTSKASYLPRVTHRSADEGSGPSRQPPEGWKNRGPLLSI